MKPCAVAVIAITLAGSFAPSLAAPPQKPTQIRGEGCVEPGAEARCIVVKDIKSGHIYSLVIKGLQPEIGSGIEFSGVPHDGVTTCMQGVAVEVQTWARKDSLKCTEGAAPRK